MIRTTLACTAVLALLTLNLTTAGEKQNDQQAIQGTWELVSGVFDGKPSKVQGGVWALSKSHVIYSFEAKDEYILYPDKNPKWIDFIDVQADKKPRKFYGIYALDGNSLTICLGIKEEKRPAKFESTEGSGQNLITLKRISKNVKEWPAPEKTFGKRFDPKFIKAADRKPDAVVSKILAKESQFPVLTIAGRDIDFIYTLAFSPDGKTLASGSASKGVMLWDAKTGDFIASLQGHARDISSVVFSRDGKLLATSSYDKTIDLWDLTTEKHVRTIYPGDGSISAIALSPDNKTLASASTNRPIKFWEVDTGKRMAATKAQDTKAYSLIFSQDSKTIVSACEDKIIRFSDVHTGEQIEAISGHTDLVSSVTISPDGKLLASSGRDKTIKLWNFETRKLIATLNGHSDWVRSVAFSSDGKTLASGSFDHSVKLWDVETRKNTLTLSGHKDFVASVAFSPKDRVLASGGWDYQIKLWTLPAAD